MEPRQERRVNREDIPEHPLFLALDEKARGRRRLAESPGMPLGPLPVVKEAAIILAVALAVAMTPSVAAQESEAEAAPADEEQIFGEEIIVTAQKREQNLLDVPLSLSAITETTIEDSGLTGIQDLSQMTPGLVYSENIGRQTTSPSIRGIAPFGFADPTVQVLTDGFTLGFNRSGNNATLFDLERIEVLRGPQATLYGRNAIGGVINLITRGPSNDFRGSVLAEAGTRDSYLLQGSLSGSLVEDKLFAGLAVGYRTSGGFMDNIVTGARDVNDEEDLNARLRLRMTPGDSMVVNLTVDYNEADDAAGDPSHVLPSFFSADPPSLAEIGAGAVDFNDFTRTLSQDVLGGFVRDEITAVLRMSYQFGSAELTSITGFADQFSDVATDVTRTPGPSFFGDFFDVVIDNEGWSQELRLTSTGGGDLQWLVGAYYYENTRNRLLIFNGGSPFSNSDTEAENAALFVNLEYAVSDVLSLSGGLRFDHEDRRQVDNFAGTEVEADFDEILPNLTLSYRPTGRSFHLYGTVSRGYHAGGTNTADAVAAGAPAGFDSEFLTNYEIGVKGASADGKLRYETAVFYMDWTDQQVQTALTPIVGFITNAGESRVQGLELSGRYSPLHGLDFSLALSLLDAEYSDYFNPINTLPFGVDPQLAGNQLIHAADVSASFSTQYIRAIGQSDWYARVRGEVNHVDERPFDATNLLVADAYTIVNLYLGVQKEDLEIGLFANNAFDEDYLTGGFLPSVFFSPLLTVGDPSVFGVRARVRF